MLMRLECFCQNEEEILAAVGTPGTGVISEEPTIAGVFMSTDLQDTCITSGYGLEADFDHPSSAQRKDDRPVGD